MKIPRTIKQQAHLDKLHAAGHNKGKTWKVKDTSNLCGRPQGFKKGITIATGKDHPRWKGDAAGYRALHQWIQKELGKPHFCENCGAKHLKHRQYHWANVSGEYKRDIDDWRRLCAKCHKKFDKKIC